MAVPDAARGKITEIFSSLQGEGIFLGERQLFIRFSGCSLRCSYCDTLQSITEEGHTLMSVQDILSRIRDLDAQKAHKTIAVTGGEPLLQADFLQRLLPEIKRMPKQIFLETSGVHPHFLEKVIDECDVIAMDLKPPSHASVDYWHEHQAFLQIAQNKVFIKMILTMQTTDEEFVKAIDLAAAANPIPPFVLQPVTPIQELNKRLAHIPLNDQDMIHPPSPARLMGLWELARHRLPDVRLIPQMHPVWGML